MAQSLETSNAGENDEEANNFVFDEWINKNGLQEIKQVFVEHETTSIDTLDANNNKNFGKILSDSRILTKPHLIATIFNAIQSLEQLRKKLQSSSKQLVFMTKKENDEMIQIKQYVDKMDDLQNEFKNINENYQNKKKENITIIQNKHKNSMQRLDEIDNEIKSSYNKLHHLLNDNEQKLHEKINNYKQELNKFVNTNDSTTNTLNKKLKNCQIAAVSNKNYYLKQMKNCKIVINKFSDNNNMDFTIKNEEREKQIVKLGNETKEYYQKQMIDINKNKNEIVKYIQNDVISNDDEKDELYSINIDKEIYDNIADDLSLYICIGKIDNESKKMSKNQQIKSLQIQLSDTKKQLEEIRKKLNEKQVIQTEEKKSNDLIQTIKGFDKKYTGQRWKLSNNNLTITGVSRGGNYAWIYATDNGYNKGVYCWSVKQINGTDYISRCIGITSEFDTRWTAGNVSSTTKWREVGSYSYYDGNEKPNWCNSEIVTVKLDCDLGIVTYYKNGAKIKQENIMKNKKYYFAMSVCADRYFGDQYESVECPQLQ